MVRGAVEAYLMRDNTYMLERFLTDLEQIVRDEFTRRGFDTCSTS